MEKKEGLEIGSTTPALFRETAARLGKRVALRHKELGLWNDISWAGYYERAGRVASALMAMGLKKGECVSIIGDNCHQWVVADLGIQCAGGISVGIYATSAAPQVEYVLNDSESRFLFAENEEQLDKFLRIRENLPHLKKVIVWDLEGLRDFSDPLVMTFDRLVEAGEAAGKADPVRLEARIESVVPEDVCVLIYTSGTTGPPKGAMLTHKNVTWMSLAMSEKNPVFQEDEVLSFLPLCHIFERLFSVFGHLAHGYTVNFIEKPDTVTGNMVEVSPTIGYAVPRIWEKYFSAISIRMSDATWFKRLVYNTAVRLGRKRTDLRMNLKKVPRFLELAYRLAYFAVFRKLKERMGFDRYRVAYSGAAPISPEVLSFFQSIGVNLIEGYGQTEGTGVTCNSPMDRPRYGTVGTPLPGIQVRIAEDGEILVKGPNVFKGYFKNPGATAETIVNGWLQSGDVGAIDDEGYLTITDRKKDIIVTAGGKNITPQYIENKIKSSVYINDAVVIGDRRKYLTSLVMIDEETVVKFAQDNKIQFSTYRDLTASQEVVELIQGELDQVNASLARVENVRKFTILPKKLYEEDGEVTPTMKVKRASIHKAFGELIEAMY